MTKRESVEKTVRDKKSPVLPYHVSFFSVTEKMVKEHFKCKDTDKAVGNFVKWYGIEVPWQEMGENLERDEFGVVWKTNPFNRGNIVESPLKEPDIKKLCLPEYPYRKIFASLDELLRKNRDYYNILWVGDMFERCHMLRGMEEALLDFYEHPRFLEEMLEKLSDLIVRNIEASRDSDFQAVFLSDDYGSQNSLLIGREMWKKFIRPHLAKIADAAHACGKKFFLHSDGNVAELVADFIELGVDALHPVQSESMDFMHLKKEYGKDICFYGGIGTQGLLRSGSPEQVKKEVERVARQSQEQPAFIFAPTLQLMEDVPFKNILALLEVLRHD